MSLVKHTVVFLIWTDLDEEVLSTTADRIGPDSLSGLAGWLADHREKELGVLQTDHQLALGEIIT